jgi:hypothetical protein
MPQITMRHCCQTELGTATLARPYLWPPTNVIAVPVEKQSVRHSSSLQTPANPSMTISLKDNTTDCLAEVLIERGGLLMVG